MPVIIPAHVALRSKLKDEVHHALVLNERLENIIAVKSRINLEGFHGKLGHGPPPWNAGAANAIMDLHAGVRDVEACLRISLKLPKRFRGGSSDNTRAALENVVRLAEGADDHIVAVSTRWLGGWCRKASVALGEAETPRRLPRIEGQKEAVCPFCECHTLRMLPLYGSIKCISPDCKDDEGRKPSAKLEYSEHVGDWLLRWQDGIAGVPVAA